MNNALPAILAVLTALVTTGLVHAVYAILWLARSLTGGPKAFDWTEALTVSGISSGLVLIIALVARSLVNRNAPHNPKARRPTDPQAVNLRRHRRNKGFGPHDGC